MSNQKLLQKWVIEYKRGFSRPLVLLMLKQEDEYPYALTKRVIEATKGQISIAASNIYPILSDLEEKGLIVSQTNDITKRKLYSLSEVGKSFLDDLKLNLEEFTNILLDLIK